MTQQQIDQITGAINQSSIDATSTAIVIAAALCVILGFIAGSQR